jgi:hypothetical protein
MAGSAAQIRRAAIAVVFTMLGSREAREIHFAERPMPCVAMRRPTPI